MSTLAVLLPLIALFQQPPAPPKLDARLIVADPAVAPGGSTTLAVQLTVEPGWHIYDPILLDTGAPTQISFDLPAGVTVGPLQFPAPHFGQEGEIAYLAHEGTITVLTTLSVAEDVPPVPLPIRAKVFALACKQLCVPVNAEADLLLNAPLAAPDDNAARVIADARAALPRPLGSADYLSGSRVLATHTQVPIGGEAEIVAAIRVQRGHHIQAHQPAKGFIPSAIFVEQRNGIKIHKDEIAWPKPHVRKVPGVGNIPELSGEFLVRVPIVVNDAQFTPGPVALDVLFQYQACEDSGQCFMPMMARGQVEFEVVPADAPAVANADPLLKDLPPRGPEAVAAATSGGGAEGPSHSLWAIFGLAFLGGVILNVMPCVLPVISLKIFGFVQQAGDDPGRVLRMGLVYALGIMASFAVIAVVMVTAGLAWGGLMQRPEFLIGLSAVVFAFALSLLGVFEINLPGAAASAAAQAGAKEGYGGAFFNGIMATLLATPCVGPFLGSAVGVLAKLPPLVAGSGIMVVGLGLAAPYVLLTAFPGWLKFLPKPGPWMVTFKQVVGFILVTVVVWLLSILIYLINTGSFLGTLGLLTAVGVGCWMIGKISLSDSARRATTIWISAAVLVIGGGWSSFRVFNMKSDIPWQPWSPGIAAELSAQGYTVYVDYTATWCLTCQTNKTLVLETRGIAGEFRRLGVYPIKADFTNFDADMQKELQAHGRNGVPLNLIYPAGKPEAALVLPELLTTRGVRTALEQAGPSERIPTFWQDDPSRKEQQATVAKR